MRYLILSVLTAALASSGAGPTRADGDPAAGERAFKRMCSGCHTVKPDGHSAAGPNLFGVFGATAGQNPNARYSKAHQESGLVLDAVGLDRYLADFQAAMPGTKKSAKGVKDDARRADIIAYIATLTAN